jgi:hypothetical protein
MVWRGSMEIVARLWRDFSIRRLQGKRLMMARFQMPDGKRSFSEVAFH